ncbi:MAG: dockerin type I domain-containing protein [Ruminococcus sp.]|nr:dockerin type I domain-containing protein [Ruminococcus sp.]
MKNKRKIHRITSTVLAAVMLFGMATTGASAQVVGESLSFEAVSGAQTVVTNQNGDAKTYDGVPDAAQWQNTAAVNRVNSYEVRYTGDTLMKVELHNIKNTAGVGAQAQPMNAYYAVEFDLDGNQTAFVTGLTADNVQKLQDAMIQAHKNNTPFDLTDAGFIDAELSGKAGVDKNLNWAAASANLLTYTGWAAKAGFKNEDEVFSAFASAFEDKVNLFDNGLPWYFNGFSYYSDIFEDYMPKIKSGTGGYLSDYDITRLYETNSGFDYSHSGYFLTNPEAWKDMTQKLRGGSGVLLSMYDFGEENYIADADVRILTCWGYVADNNYNEDSINHYKTLIISDGSSDMTGSKSRSSAPNRMTAADIKPEKAEELDFDYFEDLTLTGYEKYRVHDFVIIKPYSDDLPCETSSLATRDKVNTADFTVEDLLLNQPLSISNDENETVFPDDQPLTIEGMVYNASVKDYEGSVQVKFTVKSESGRAVFNRTQSCYIASVVTDTPKIEIGKLPVGKYTAEITVNPSKTIKEAYYYNNTRTLNFEVRKPAIDKSKVKIVTEKPYVDSDRVMCDFRVDGLSDELRGKITGYDIALNTYDLYGDEDGQSALSSNEIKTDGVLPCSVSIPEYESCEICLKLEFNDAPPLYLESDKVLNPYPVALLQNAEYFDDDYDYEDDINHALTPVRRNVRSLANGEVMKVAVTDYREDGMFKSFTLQYHLEAVNRFGKHVVLTKPESVTISGYDEKYITFSRFDYPIPQGQYTLKVVADNDVLLYDYMEPYLLTSGSGYDGGDLNGDGQVNIDDVTMLQKYLANRISFTETQLRDADVNGDGIVDIIDASVIQQYLSGEKWF